ncbi:MAG: DUF2167 domain-containing protein [Pseudomonadota bacterium]
MSLKELMLACLLMALAMPYTLANATALVTGDAASVGAGAAAEQIEEEEEEEEEEGLEEDAFLASLKFQSGKVQVGDNLATFDLPQDLVFLNSQDAERVLVEAWGNPPSEPLPLGMIIPKGISPLAEESWAVTVEYEQDGHISDKDAADIDYTEMLEELQEESDADNQWRRENGYEAVTLVGWAAQPHYDAVGKKLHWAKELKFGDAEYNTLNYNIRVLGRRGVLVLNFIANMDQLPDIERHLPGVLAMIEFNPGNRYAEFDPEQDKVAEQGMEELISGERAAQAGLAVTALLLLKKFFFVPLAIAGWLFSRLRRKKPVVVQDSTPPVPPQRGPDLSKRDPKA